jgi:hypothetical protein
MSHHIPLKDRRGYVKMALEDLQYMTHNPKEFTRDQVLEQREVVKDALHGAEPVEDEQHAARTIQRAMKKHRGRGRTRRGRRHRGTRRR